MISFSKRLAPFVLSLGLAIAFLAPASGVAADALAEKAALQEVSLGISPDIEDFGELRQSAALLTDGSYATAWIDRQLGAQMQWVRPDGTPVFAGGGRALTAPSSLESDTVVAANPAGGAFTAVARLAGNGRQILVQSFDADGNPRWAGDGVVAAARANGDDQHQPQLVAAPQGGVYLCLQQFHSIGGQGSDIVCQRFAADGRRLWSDAGVKAGGRSGYKSIPRVVRDDRNGLLVFWRNGRNGSASPQAFVLIEGQHLAPDGGRSWGAQGRIVRSTNQPANSGSSEIALQAASDGQGGAVLAFDDGPGPPDVFAQRVSGDARLLWGNGAAVAAGKTYQAVDSLTATPDGGAFVTVWQPNGAISQRLNLYRLGADGKVRSNERLNTLESGRLSWDWGAYGNVANGRLRLVWNHARQDGSGLFDVQLGLFDLAGHRLDGPSGTPLLTSPLLRVVRGFVFDPTRRQGLVVWVENRDGEGDYDAMGGIYRE
jgi:hypothetical protein